MTEDFNPEFIYEFPEPGSVTPLMKDICAVTDDIDLQLLYSAYMQGIFPWFNEDDGDPVLWFNPDPRFVIFPDEFHVPRSLRKFLKKNVYTYTMDKCFARVIEECSKMTREGQDGTWIGNKIKRSYTEFHEAGFAHSVEVWHEGELVGGFYGVLLGSVFCGESMFTKMSDSSKSAFALFMQAFISCGGILLDSQSHTDNIERYGARNIPRKQFLEIEETALCKPLEKDLKTEFLRIANRAQL